MYYNNIIFCLLISIVIAYERWEYRTDKSLFITTNTSRVRHIIMSKNSEHIYVANPHTQSINHIYRNLADGSIQHLNSSTMYYSKQSIYDFSYQSTTTSDGSFVYLPTFHQTVNIFYVTKRKIRLIQQLSLNAHHIALSNDELWLYVLNSAQLYRYSVNKNSMSNHVHSPQSIALSSYLKGDDATTLKIDDINDSIWIGTNQGLLYHFKSTTNAVFTVLESIELPLLTSFASEPIKNLAVNTNLIVHSYQDSSSKQRTYLRVLYRHSNTNTYEQVVLPAVSRSWSNEIINWRSNTLIATKTIDCICISKQWVFVSMQQDDLNFIVFYKRIDYQPFLIYHSTLQKQSITISGITCRDTEIYNIDNEAVRFIQQKSVPPYFQTTNELTVTAYVGVYFQSNIINAIGAREYTISPTLPKSLSINNINGKIYGNPDVIIWPPRYYTVMARNPTGVTMTRLLFGVQPAHSCSYSRTNFQFSIYQRVLLQPLGDKVQFYSAYHTNSTLPIGLQLDTSTGIISGIIEKQTYQNNIFIDCGYATQILYISILPSPDRILYHHERIKLIVGESVRIVPIQYKIGNWSITPLLPNGLTFDSNTGIIEGSAYVVVYPEQKYNILPGPSELRLTIVSARPVLLEYKTSVISKHVNEYIELLPSKLIGMNNKPIVGVSYIIEPSLPNGLVFNSQTGNISGQVSNVYKNMHEITAQTINGERTSTLLYLYFTRQPLSLYYEHSRMSLYVNTTIVPNNIVNIPNNLNSQWSISPSLPNGLILNSNNGTISGTPINVSSSWNTYTIYNNQHERIIILLRVLQVLPKFYYTFPSIVYNISTPIINNTLVVATTSLAYTLMIDPPTLPKGLYFDSTTGTIYGTPIETTSNRTYRVIMITNDTRQEQSTYIYIRTTVHVSQLSFAYSNSTLLLSTNTPFTMMLQQIPTVTNVEFVIFPNLVSGLFINRTSGSIQGTPLLPSTSIIYTVSAVKDHVVFSQQLNITISGISVAPSISTNEDGLALFDMSVVYTVNIPIPLNRPIRGLNAPYSIIPSLPNGLNLDTNTGYITGTPLTISELQTYTFYNGRGESVNLFLQVNDASAAYIYYPQRDMKFIYNTISAIYSPVYQGSNLRFWTDPPLPSGLTIDPISGNISGISTTISERQVYLIFGENSAGRIETSVWIAVVNNPPITLSYPKTFYQFTLETDIGTAIIPSITSGGNKSLNYTVTPPLTIGLNLNPSNGQIYGAASDTSDSIWHKITARNSGGSATTHILIRIEYSSSQLANFHANRAETRMDINTRIRSISIAALCIIFILCFIVVLTLVSKLKRNNKNRLIKQMSTYDYQSQIISRVGGEISSSSSDSDLEDIELDEVITRQHSNRRYPGRYRGSKQNENSSNQQRDNKQPTLDGPALSRANSLVPETNRANNNNNKLNGDDDEKKESQRRKAPLIKTLTSMKRLSKRIREKQRVHRELPKDENNVTFTWSYGDDDTQKQAISHGIVVEISDEEDEFFRPVARHRTQRSASRSLIGVHHKRRVSEHLDKRAAEIPDSIIHLFHKLNIDIHDGVALENDGIQIEHLPHLDDIELAAAVHNPEERQRLKDYMAEMIEKHGEDAFGKDTEPLSLSSIHEAYHQYSD